jgi:hypothetical protein
MNQLALEQVETKGDYIVLHAHSTLDLEREVNEVLNDGYEPVGGMSIIYVPDEQPDTTLYQAVYRKPQRKTRARKPKFDPPCPAGVKPEVWESYIKQRREKRNPVTKSIYEGLCTSLEKWRAEGHDPNAIVATSAGNGWVGLFPPKDAKPKTRLEFFPDNDEELVAWARRIGAPDARPNESYTEYRARLRKWYEQQ